MAAKRVIAFAFYGTRLDYAGFRPTRWNVWRPTLALCRHEDLVIHRLELFGSPDHEAAQQQLIDDIRVVSPETDVRVHDLGIQRLWDFEEVYARMFDFAQDYAFEPESEDYFVHMATGTHVNQICLFLLTESRQFPARLVQTQPPAQNRQGDPGGYTLIDLDLSRYDQIRQRVAVRRQRRQSFLKSGIETRNANFNLLIERMEHVAARSRDPILLLGPTGSGKSRLARLIDALKRETQNLKGNLVEVNCATLRGDSAMSALFGHVKGAFTGAASTRQGYLRAADKGLLFLDEIGELGLDEQAMLLRAIEEKTFLPLGSDQETQSDFQLIAGTNQDLQARTQSGDFREDLLARINLWTFRLPPLRERLEDVEPNLRYELDQHQERSGERLAFARKAWDRYLSFATSPEATWSSNFRDLNASVRRMATLSERGLITDAHVDEEIQRLRAFWQPSVPVKETAEQPIDLPPDLDSFDAVQLSHVLSVCRQSATLSEAGRTLFAVSRRKRKASNDTDRLRKYLLRFGIDPAQALEPPSFR